MTTGGVAASDQYSLGMVGVELRVGAAPSRRERSVFRLRRGDDEGLDRLIARPDRAGPGAALPGHRGGRGGADERRALRRDARGRRLAAAAGG
jgi:hypothetical protein